MKRTKQFDPARDARRRARESALHTHQEAELAEKTTWVPDEQAAQERRTRMKDGKFITANEAKATKKQHTSPCSDCPFRRDSAPGWLGDMSAEEWHQLAHGEGSADCHATKRTDGGPWQCAGLAVYRANVCKSVRDESQMRLPADRVTVFSFGEFVNHHTKKLKRGA